MFSRLFREKSGKCAYINKLRCAGSTFQLNIIFFKTRNIFTTIYIGGSRGGVRDARPPPGRPNSFDFMQFSGKFGMFTPPLEGSRPPLGKILDPPLIYITYKCCYLRNVIYINISINF